MLIEEAINTNFTVFGLNRQGQAPPIDKTEDAYAYYYHTDAVYDESQCGTIKS